MACKIIITRGDHVKHGDLVQIQDHTGSIVHEWVSGVEILEYEIRDNIIIFETSDRTKFGDRWYFFDLKSMKLYSDFLDYDLNLDDRYSKDNPYNYLLIYRDGKVIFEDNVSYEPSYFFANMRDIIEKYEVQRRMIDLKADTLLNAIFRHFNITLEDDLIFIDGFTFGMKCHSIDTFKKIMRNYELTIEEQLIKELFVNCIPYDLKLNVIYNKREKISFFLRCTSEAKLECIKY